MIFPKIYSLIEKKYISHAYNLLQRVQSKIFKASITGCIKASALSQRERERA